MENNYKPSKTKVEIFVPFNKDGSDMEDEYGTCPFFYSEQECLEFIEQTVGENSDGCGVIVYEMKSSMEL